MGALEVVTDPVAWPQLAAVLGMTLLALLLLYANFNKAANRAFALFLILRALSMASATFREFSGVAGDVTASMFWDRMFPYFIIPLPFIMLHLISIYPSPRGWLGRSRAGAGLLTLGAAACVGLYAWDHALWGDLFSPGPLLPLFALMYLGFAAVAFVFLRSFSLAPPGPRRRSMLLVGAGFTLNTVFEGVSAAIFVAQGGPLLLTLQALLLAVVIVLAGVALAARRAFTTEDAEVRRTMRRFLGALVLAIVTAFTILPPFADFYVFPLGLWRLALPALVTYSLIRHQLFDVDLKIRWTIKQSTVAAIFIGVFFIVSEGAQQFFSEEGGLGPYLGIAAAGVLVFAIAPLQNVAERVAKAAMPVHKPVGELTGTERETFYKEQVEVAWSDGTLSQKERVLLDNLRTRLGLDMESAARLEMEVTRSALAAQRKVEDPAAAPAAEPGPKQGP